MGLKKCLFVVFFFKITDLKWITWEFPGGLAVKDTKLSLLQLQVTAVVPIRSLAGELLHATGCGKKNNNFRFPAVVQQDQQHLCSTRTQVQSPAWHMGQKILCCHSCGIDYNYDSDLFIGPGIPYAMGQPKKKKKKKNLNLSKGREILPLDPFGVLKFCHHWHLFPFFFHLFISLLFFY